MKFLKWLFGDKVEAYLVPSGVGVIAHSASGCPPVEKRPVNLKIGKYGKEDLHRRPIHCHEDDRTLLRKNTFLYDENNLMVEYECSGCKKRFVIFDNFIEPECKKNTDPNVVYHDAADNPWHCGRKMKRAGYRTKSVGETPGIMLNHRCERCGTEKEVWVRVGAISLFLEDLKNIKKV